MEGDTRASEGVRVFLDGDAMGFFGARAMVIDELDGTSALQVMRVYERR